MSRIVTDPHVHAFCHSCDATIASGERFVERYTFEMIAQDNGNAEHASRGGLLILCLKCGKSDLDAADQWPQPERVFHASH